MAKSIVALIPARSGSEGLKGKNIKMLGGKPLIAHSIEPSLVCANIKKTYISSDSQDYLKIGSDFGAEPYLRPKPLGDKETTMLEVIKDFVKMLKSKDEYYDAILVLYPTYPFRTPDQLENIINFYFEQEDCSSVIGLKKPDTHPYLCAKRSENGSVDTYVEFDINTYYRRQDYPECFQFTAWAMVVTPKYLGELNAQVLSGKTRGYVIPQEFKIVDIDTLEDFEYAEFLIDKGYV